MEKLPLIVTATVTGQLSSVARDKFASLTPQKHGHILMSGSLAVKFEEFHYVNTPHRSRINTSRYRGISYWQAADAKLRHP